MWLFSSTQTVTRHQGFIGTYHTPSGRVQDGHNTSAFDTGAWGVVSPTNEPSDGGVAFKEDLTFLCSTASVNSVWGMVIANTEGGVFNNPNDTAPFLPLPVRRGGGGPRGSAGMVQGAARFSFLSREFCPQIGGIIVDDFWSNYNASSPPSSPSSPCATCPAVMPHMYGTWHGGYYCCTWSASGHCTPPAGVPATPPCCLVGGAEAGCQGKKRCGNNPLNHMACGSEPPLNKAAMIEISAALSGKQLSAPPCFRVAGALRCVGLPSRRCLLHCRPPCTGWLTDASTTHRVPPRHTSACSPSPTSRTSPASSTNLSFVRVSYEASRFGLGARFRPRSTRI